MLRRSTAVQLATLLLLTFGCSAADAAPPTPTSISTAVPSSETSQSAPAVVLPPPGAGFDYQLSGDYPLPSGATVVVRQWYADPAPQAYSICYVNAFQTEAETDSPDGPDAWPEGTVWREADDPNWPGEYPIDTSTDEKRRLATEFVDQRFEECVDRGFAAVELDNLDSFTRYPDAPFDRDDAIAYATLLVDAATRRGLAVGQKNTVELLDVADRIGFGFAVVEDCGAFDECRDYLEVYGRRIYAIEYSDEGLAAACAAVGTSYTVIRRDLQLTTPGHPDHVHRTC